MKWLNKIFNKQEIRNMAFSDMYQAQQSQPVYTDFTVYKAVKEGLKTNVWVYRCINLIVQASASVPWVVERDGEVVDGHALNILLGRPNPFLTRQQLFEMLISWIQLAGNAYLKKVQTGKRTVELWPISPDRLHPVPSADLTEWIAGYSLDTNTRIEFEPDEIIHLTAIQDPSNPLIGLSPLQAAGRIVDADNAQQAYGVAAMQNQGSTSGVWTFERSFANQDEADAISDKLNERYAGANNAKRMIVVGSNAKFQSTQMTPTEMDFIETRKNNRNEIFLAFGIPPAYGGSEQASTYNNFQSSELIFWNQTILPLLNDIRDSLNHALFDELGENERITYDVSNVEALRTAQLEKVKTSEILSKIGVPFEQINSKFEFGFEEYDGWDKSNASLQESLPPGEQEQEEEPKTLKKQMILDFGVRTIAADIENMAANDIFTRFFIFFEDQSKRILKDIEKNKGTNIRTIIDNDADVLKELFVTAYKDVAGYFASKVIVNKRDAADTLITQILGDLTEIAGVESGLINQTTVDTLAEQISQGLEDGWSIQDFQTAIIDTGIFGPERALRIARTVSTGAANLGQVTGARETGATHKEWHIASFAVRDTHQHMSGVKVPIDEPFNVAGHRAMYPGDNTLPAKERVNCRCSMLFTIEG